LVVLFPEGTSSGGETVLPFKSSLLAAATSNQHALTAGCVCYELADGVVSEEVCYWKDMTLVPHLINLLSKRRIHAELHFAETRQKTTDRKVLARHLHSQVLALKTILSRTRQFSAKPVPPIADIKTDAEGMWQFISALRNLL
jgi:1-acyl-sn-glycerol-3-phosphate acyltransferase